MHDQRASYAVVPPLRPSDWDTSAYEASLASVSAERDALRARLVHLDRAEAALRREWAREAAWTRGPHDVLGEGEEN